MTLVLSGVAIADVVINNLDGTVDATLEIMSLEVGGANGSTVMTVTAADGADPVTGCNHRGPGGQVTLGVKSSNTAVATVSPSTIQFTGCASNPGSTATVTVTPVGNGSATINLSTATADGASLTTTSGATLANYNVAPAAFTVNVTTPAPSNTAPSAPGKPGATPASPNQGGFTLNWTASTDDGNPNPPGAITYELEGKDANDAAFGVVASGLATNSYGFATSAPLEGTWTYRVQASDSALTSDWSISSDPIVVDRTAPTFGSCPAGGPFLLNSGGGSQNVGPISASDGPLPDDSVGSGVDAGASTLSGTVSTTSVGSKDATFTAVDNAGNSTQTSCSYSVVYAFDGFFDPVNNPGWTEKGTVINKAVAGKTIPLKWRLTDANGDPVLDLGSVNVQAVTLSCSLGSSTDLLEEYASGNSGLQNLGNGYYQFNWATPKAYASSCKTLRLTLNDGSVHTAEFQFTK
jgi:hypothetical protein